MNGIRRIEMLSAFVLLVLLTSLFAGCLNDSSDKNMEYGADFQFTLLNGEKKSMSDYKGKIVLLDFMGANCGPCQLQIYVLEQLYDEYKNDGLEIVSIDVWIISGETIDIMHQFIQAFQQQGLDLDWLFGVDDTSGTLYYKYADSGVPMLYLLDKNGNIYYTKAGYTEYSVLAGKIDELLD